MYVLTCLHLPHALTESQFDQSALSALLLCFVIPGFLAMGWQFVKVSTEAKSVSSASSAMKLVIDVLVEVGDIEIGISFPPEDEAEIDEEEETGDGDDSGVAKL